MRTHNSFLLAAAMVLLALLSPQGAEAASGTVQKIWLEHNVMYGGRKCLAIHVTVEVVGMRGRKVRLAAYLDSPQGTKHVDTNGQYRASDGQVAVYGSSKATYESTLWNDWVLYLPNDEIHPKVGQHDYFIQVQAKDGSTLLAESEYVSFSMTGSAAGSAAGSAVCTNCGGSCRVGCAKCNGSGFYVSGIVVFSCSACGGQGTIACGLCGGTGRLNVAPAYAGGGGAGSSYGAGVYGGSSGVYGGGSGSYGSGSSGSGSTPKKCPTCLGDGHCHARSSTADRYYCWGDGVCRNCSGKGYVYSMGNEVKCTYCHGNGRCTWCGGTGKCKTCGGRGTL